jgi:UDP-N-acetylglucosamine/UDP-N-acetylgalactosamine diphosphorylase
VSFFCSFLSFFCSQMVGFRFSLASSSASVKIEPFPNVATLDGPTAATDREGWRLEGLQKIAEGKVAVLLLAGGQGTRLGTKDPKGMYDVGLPSGKTLFQLQAERLKRVAQLAKVESGTSANVVVPWYVMTSGATDAATKEYFASKDFFGLGEENVFFFQQDMMPCMTPEGKLMLATKSTLAAAPNGNGGLYNSMDNAGALADMKKRGVELVCQYGVDNALIRMADPTFVGYCFATKADCGVKVVPKASADEAVGVLTLRDGKPGVTEYSEISKEDAERTDANGKLALSASHVCINAYSVAFLEEIAATHFRNMPPHIAKKKIPFCNDAGEVVTPDDVNGWKLELFIFDIFDKARKLVAFEASRAEEFSPLKNAPGNPSDSPDTCRAHVSAMCKKFLRDAGATLSDDADNKLVEISPLRSYAGENLEEYSGKTVSVTDGLLITDA